MQRRSSRKITTSGLIPTDVETQDSKVTEEQQEEDYYGVKSIKLDVNITTIFKILKYLFILILLLPWIVTFSTKVKENDYIPKLQRLVEDTFMCPVVLKGNHLYANCTCENKTSNIPTF